MSASQPPSPPARAYATWAVYDDEGDVLTRGIRCSISLTAEQVVQSAHAAAAEAMPFARRVVVTYCGDVVCEELVGDQPPVDASLAPVSLPWLTLPVSPESEEPPSLSAESDCAAERCVCTARAVVTSACTSADFADGIRRLSMGCSAL